MQSLSKLPEDDESLALQVFSTILTYAGLGQDGMYFKKNIYILSSFMFLYILCVMLN